VLGATNVLDVDAIEQHTELSGVEGDSGRTLADAGKTKATAL
jgi:hypothetical protein